MMKTEQLDSGIEDGALAKKTGSSADRDASELPNARMLAAAIEDRRSRSKGGAIARLWIGVGIAAAPAVPIAAFVGDLPSAAIYAATAFAGLTIFRLARGMEEATLAHVLRLDGRWIGALTEGLAWRGNARMRAFSRRYLPELLATASADELAVLNEDQRAILSANLTVASAIRYAELTTAIANVMPQVGDEDSVWHLRRLALMRPAPPHAAQVRLAAQIALPEVEQRILEQRRTAVPSVAATAMSAGVTVPTVPATDQQSAPSAAMTYESPTVSAGSKDLETSTEAPEKNQLSPPAMRQAFLVASWCVITPYTGFGAWYLAHSGSWLPAGAAAALCAGSTQLHRLTLLAKHREYARRLTAMEDVKVIGELADALSWPDAALRELTIRALARLLPKLRASDAPALDARQRESLYSMLQLSHAKAHGDFLLALLKALEQIGDEAAIPYVRNLANAAPKSGRERQISKAARDCLPFLIEVASQNRDSRTLLRASAASGQAPATLLRPAEATHEVDPANLLRPSTSGNGGL